MNKLSVIDVINKFNFKLIANKDSLNNQIEYIELYRAAFELCGIFLYKPIKSIIYFGNKESTYLNKLDEDLILKRIEGIFELSPPLIILGKNFKQVDAMLAISKKYKNVPVVQTKFNQSDLSYTLTQYMIHQMIEYKLYHGSLLEIYGVGVMIIGSSGIGKTEVMVELIKKGHIFVADDSIDISRVGTSLLAKPSTITKDFIEIRGLGLLNAKKTFGYNKCIDNTTIKVVIELVQDTRNTNYERIGNILYKNIEGVDVHYYKIPVSTGRNLSDIIESAIVDYKLKLDGYISKNELKARLDSKKDSKNGG